MRILVTGGHGFIGSNLVKKIDARVFTLDSTEGNRNHICADIRDKGLSLKSFDVIYHLAAISSPKISETNRKLTWDVNVNGTQNIIEKLRGGQHLIFTSSAQVYGRSKTRHKEREKPEPRNFYGLTKSICEEMIRYYSIEKGFTSCILRLFNIYGIGQSTGFLIPDVIEKYKTQDVVEVINPDAEIDFVYIDDVVEALNKANKAEGIYNIGSGKGIKIKRIYEIVKNALGVDAKEIIRKGKNDKLVADITEAKKTLKWKPRIEIKDGIRRIIRWKGF